MAGSDQAAKVSESAGRQVRDGLRAMLGEKDGVGIGIRTVSNAVGAMIGGATAMVMAVFGAVFRVASELAAIFLESLEGTVRDNQEAMNNLIAASMTDLLSIDVSGDDISKGGGPGDQLRRAVQIGSKLHELLIDEFGGRGGPEGVNGEQAARAFTGFNISFSVRAALLSIVTEIESLGFFKEFREVGEQMATSLALGRLHRQALMPLVKHLITTPYDRQLSKRYRQTLISDSDYVDAMARGDLTMDQCIDLLAQKGYTDSDIQAVIISQGKKLSVQEVDVLLRFGEITQDAAIEQLSNAGFTRPQAQLKLRAAVLNDVQQAEHAYAQEVLRLAQDRGIDSTTYATLIDRLHFPDELKQVWLNRLGVYLDSHHKALSLGEMRFLAEHNVINSDDMHQWAIGQGYTENDAFLLELDLAVRQQVEGAKEKVAQFKYAQAVAKAKSKGLPIPPPPPGVQPV